VSLGLRKPSERLTRAVVGFSPLWLFNRFTIVWPGILIITAVSYDFADTALLCCICITCTEHSLKGKEKVNMGQSKPYQFPLPYAATASKVRVHLCGSIIGTWKKCYSSHDMSLTCVSPKEYADTQKQTRHTGQYVVLLSGTSTEWTQRGKRY
jgi:hypothetical protein